MENNNLTISKWIKSNIEKFGANVFFDNINNLWEDYAYDVRNMILDEIYKYIKPSKIETIEDLAKLLNYNEYLKELDNKYDINIEELCKQNKWVICFPYSDDNIEFRGYIDDEIGAWDGGYYKFYKKGDFYLDDENEETYKKAKKNMFIESTGDDCDIEAIWEENDELTNKKCIWKYVVKNKKLPYAYFYINDEENDEDEIWARCCIIDLSNI